MSETPAPALPASPKRRRSPFPRLVLVTALFAPLLLLAGAPRWAAAVIPVALALAIIAVALAVAPQPLEHAVPASLEDPRLPAEAAAFLAPLAGELQALGFSEQRLFQGGAGAAGKWWLLAANAADRAGATAILQTGAMRGSVRQLSFVTRAPDGRRIATFALNDLPLIGGSPAMEGLKLLSTSDVRRIYEVHRWRTRALGGAALPVPSAEARIARIVGPDEWVESGHWRMAANGTLRRTFRGVAFTLATIPLVPALRWRDRMRERRVLARMAAEPIA